MFVNILTASLHFCMSQLCGNPTPLRSSEFGDENNDKKRRIKVRRWTLKIICIHIKIFTIAIKILTNIDNEEWREENFEQSKYFCYRCHILRVTLVSDFVMLF
jgi:hypothetical protein